MMAYLQPASDFRLQSCANMPHLCFWVLPRNILQACSGHSTELSRLFFAMCCNLPCCLTFKGQGSAVFSGPKESEKVGFLVLSLFAPVLLSRPPRPRSCGTWAVEYVVYVNTMENVCIFTSEHFQQTAEVVEKQSDLSGVFTDVCCCLL